MAKFRNVARVVCFHAVDGVVDR